MVMQYPTFSVEELELMFEGGEDILFISNKENFRSALRANPYDDLFVDTDGISFGHLTNLGNKMVANNVATVLLEQDRT